MVLAKVQSRATSLPLLLPLVSPGCPSTALLTVVTVSRDARCVQVVVLLPARHCGAESLLSFKNLIPTYRIAIVGQQVAGLCVLNQL